MQFYQRETERLKRSERLVTGCFPRLGINQRREIVRLLYEISKREGLDPEAVLPPPPLRFGRLKDILLRRRYPSAAVATARARFYLPEVAFESESEFAAPAGAFSPERIYVEDPVWDSPLARRFRQAFPTASSARIGRLKTFLAEGKRWRISDYNRRCRTVFIIQEGHDFFKRCPCTTRAVPCGYHIFNLAFGCRYECTYCYLQQYTNTPGLVFPANLDDYFSRFRAYKESSAARRWQRGGFLRIGTGEFSDSLMLDEITDYSPGLVEFFRDQPDVRFEFKTKSNNIDNLLRVDPGGNIIVAWSLNPGRIIEENELSTASLAARLAAARRVAAAGYRLAFHFDPIFYYPGWEKEYREVTDLLFAGIAPGRIAWISLGSFRFTPELKPVIEKRFPGNTILDGELLLGSDHKLRYSARVRFTVYQKMISMLTRHSAPLPIYLCMEDREMWEALRLPFPFA